MTSQNQQSSKGRPQLTPVERELREAARRLKDLNEVRGKFDALLSLEGRSEEDAEEIKAIADKRREICRAIDHVSDEVKKAREAGDKKREAEGKEARKALYDSLNDLPELGYTHEDWEEAPASMKAKELGRPKLRIEQQLNRAEDAFVEQEGVLRKVEADHGESPAHIRDHIEEAVQPNVGRPRLGPLERLDRDLIKTEEEIDYIDSGQAKKEQDAMIQARLKELDLSDPKDLPGRPPVPVSVRRDRLVEKRENIRAKIRDHERGMTEVERIGREIDVMTLRLRSLKRKMKKEGDANGDLAKLHDSMMATLKEMESAENQLRKQESKVAHETRATSESAPTPNASVDKPEESKPVSQPEVKMKADAEPKAAQKDASTEAIKERAAQGEKQKIDSNLTSMEDTLNSLLEDLDMAVTGKSDESRASRPRLKDRLLARASNE